MRITRKKIQSVEVGIERVIEVGAVWKISSSYAFAGIDTGIVKVVGLYRKGDNSDIDNTIASWVDSGLEEVLEEYNREIERDIWVAYQYTIDKHKEIWYLPMLEFIDHISTP